METGSASASASVPESAEKPIDQDEVVRACLSRVLLKIPPADFSRAATALRGFVNGLLYVAYGSYVSLLCTFIH